MRSPYKSLQALIKEQNPRATYVWCWAHRLNLIVTASVGSSVNAMDLFGNLEKLFAFISNSKRRVHLFEEKQKKHYPNQRIRRLKRVNTTRWMSHSYALETVLITFEALLEAIEEIRHIEGPSDKQAGAQAGGFIAYFTSERFVLTATTFVRIFKIIDPFTKMLQSPDLDLLSACNVYA